MLQEEHILAEKGIPALAKSFWHLVHSTLSSSISACTCSTGVMGTSPIIYDNLILQLSLNYVNLTCVKKYHLQITGPLQVIFGRELCVAPSVWLEAWPKRFFPTWKRRQGSGCGCRYQWDS